MQSLGRLPGREFLEFVYTDEFLSSVAGVLDEMGLASLERLLLEEPARAPVIPGTGGVRKLRVALVGRGKRSGLRVLYVHVPRDARVYLLLAYPKPVRATLTEGEKAALRNWIETLRGGTMAQVTEQDFAERLLRSAEQAAAIRQGVVPAARVTRLPRSEEVVVREAPRYAASRIRLLRQRLGVTQLVFARMLGVRPPTVRAWEQERKEPSGAARRLLEIYERSPEIAAETLRRS